MICSSAASFSSARRRRSVATVVSNRSPNSLSIAFGNFRAGYLVADRGETRIRVIHHLAELPAALCAEVLARDAMVVRVPEGQPLFDEGAPCQGFPMVLSGEVRVARGVASTRNLRMRGLQAVVLMEGQADIARAWMRRMA